MNLKHKENNQLKPCVCVRSSQRRGAAVQMWSRATATEGCKRGQSPGRCTNFFSPYHSRRNVGAGRGKRLRQTSHNKKNKHEFLQNKIITVTANCSCFAGEDTK